MPKGSTYPVATSPDAFDALGVQGGVTKKMPSTLLATQAELDAQVAYLPVNAKNYATGNGVTDDTAGLAAALVAARGKSLYLPDGIYTTTTELLHDAATHGGLKIFGGPNAVIKLTGATNKGIHVTGTPGVTRAHVTLEGFSILGATSGISPAAIHLDGIADYQLHDLTITPTAKFTTGITFTGAQQGEWSGGYVEAPTCGKFELSGAVASNGCDLHGVSLVHTSVGLSLNSVDDIFIHGNHLTGSGVGVDLVLGGLGQSVIAHNHLELATVASIRLAVGANQCHIVGNSCYGAVGSSDLIVNGGPDHTIIGNLFNRDVTIAAAAVMPTFIGNKVLAAFTNGTSDGIILGNSGNAVGAKVGRDGIMFPPGNNSIGSTGTTYLEGAAINMRIAGFGPGFALDAGNVVDFVGGATSLATSPAGFGEAPPLTPQGFLRIKVGGVFRKFPFYEDAQRVIVDDFSDANGTAMNGKATDTAGVSWTCAAGVVEVQSGACTGATTSGTGPHVLSTISDCLVVARMVAAGTDAGANAGVKARQTDDENFLMGYLDRATNTAHVYRKTAGSFVSIASAAYTYPASGTVLDVRFKVVGTALTLIINGATIVTTTHTQGQTALRHGLYMATGNLASFQDFEVFSL